MPEDVIKAGSTWLARAHGAVAAVEKVVASAEVDERGLLRIAFEGDAYFWYEKAFRLHHTWISDPLEGA